MDKTNQHQISRRVASAVGHLQGVERMLKDEAYCIDIIRQIQAVQAALNKISSLILDDHLHHCVTTAVRGEDVDLREKMLSELTALFEAKNKL